MEGHIWPKGCTFHIPHLKCIMQKSLWAGNWKRQTFISTVNIWAKQLEVQKRGNPYFLIFENWAHSIGDNEQKVKVPSEVCVNMHIEQILWWFTAKNKSINSTSLTCTSLAIHLVKFHDHVHKSGSFRWYARKATFLHVWTCTHNQPNEDEKLWNWPCNVYQQ